MVLQSLLLQHENDLIPSEGRAHDFPSQHLIKGLHLLTSQGRRAALVHWSLRAQTTCNHSDHLLAFGVKLEFLKSVNDELLFPILK